MDRYATAPVFDSGITFFPLIVARKLLERRRSRPRIHRSQGGAHRPRSKMQPDAPGDDWYPAGDRQNDFGSFKLCGSGELPKTVLLKPDGKRVARITFLRHFLGHRPHGGVT